MENVFTSTFFALLATTADYSSFGNVIVGFLNGWWVTGIAIIGGLATVIAIVIGIKFWLAGVNGDEAALKKAKMTLVYYVIGLAAMFIIACGTPYLISAMSSWYENNQMY